MQTQIRRQFHGRGRDDRVEQRRRDHGADGAANRSQEQRFEHQIADQRGPAGAECRPHRQFVAPVDGAGHQQPGHVQGRNHQQQDHRAEQQRCAGLEAAAPVLAHRFDAQLQVAVHRGVRFGPRREMAGELGLGRGLRDAWCETGDRPRRAAGAVVDERRRQVLRQRRPELDDVALDRAVESRRRHADDGEDRRLSTKRPADHRGIAAKAARPEPGANHRDARRVGGEVGGGQQPPVQRAQTERREVVGRDALATQALGARVEQADGAAARRAQERVERRDPAVEVAQFGNRQRPAGFTRGRVGQPHPHQPIGVRERHAAHRHCRKKSRRSCGGRHADGGAQHGGYGQEGRTAQTGDHAAESAWIEHAVGGPARRCATVVPPPIAPKIS